jgi:hypothetical protein
MNNEYLHTIGGYLLTLSGRFGYIRASLPIVRIITSIIFVVATSGLLLAQSQGSSATQSVTIEVKPITKISVSGNPNPLIIGDAIPGSDLTSVSDANTKYSLTTNLDNMKIVASISNKMPVGTKLMVKLSSSKASSSGMVDLSGAVTPIDVVTGISKCSELNQSINYTFAANSDVSEISTQSRVVTLTLTN